MSFDAGMEANADSKPKPLPHQYLALKAAAQELDADIQEALSENPNLGIVTKLQIVTDENGYERVKHLRTTAEEKAAGITSGIDHVRHLKLVKEIENEVYGEPSESSVAALYSSLEKNPPHSERAAIVKNALSEGISGPSIEAAFYATGIFTEDEANNGFKDTIFKMTKASYRQRKMKFESRLKELEMDATIAALRWNAEKYSDISADIRRPALVADLIGVGGLFLLVGQPKSAKTFVGLHLSKCIATRATFFGHKVQQGAVLYVALEGGFAILKRISAMKKKKGCEDAPLYLARISLDLGNPKDVEDLIALAKHVAESSGFPLRLIVIDTLARAMGGRDENSAQDMGLIVRALDYLRAQTGAAVIVVHHTSKSGEQERGSSALTGAYDGKLKVTFDAKSGERKIVLENPRDFDFAPDMFFTLESVVLGKDDNGDLVSSAVVIEGGSPAGGRGAEFSPGSVEGKAFEALKAAIDSHEAPAAGDDGIFALKWVSEKAWRSKFAEMFYPNAPQSSVSSAFKRGARKIYASQSVARKGVNVAIK